MDVFLQPLLFLAQAADGAAQGAAEAAARSPAEVSSIWELIVKGGPMMIPIGLASIIALAIATERFLKLRKANVVPPSFLPGLKAILEKPERDVEEALRYCRQNDSPVAAVFAAGLRRLGEPLQLVEKHIEEAGERQTFVLRKRLRALAVIASVSPLLGLLGTILGIIQAFQTVATSGEALGQAEMLAGGIYEAMITTAAGLLVAIPTLIVYHWLSARIEALVLTMDAMAADFVEDHVRPARNAPPASDRATLAPKPDNGAAVAATEEPAGAAS